MDNGTSLQELAAEFKINAQSLRVRLWENDVKPDARENRASGKRVVQCNIYGPEKADLIRRMLKLKPIRTGRGRQKKALS